MKVWFFDKAQYSTIFSTVSCLWMIKQVCVISLEIKKICNRFIRTPTTDHQKGNGDRRKFTRVPCFTEEGLHAVAGSQAARWAECIVGTQDGVYIWALGRNNIHCHWTYARPLVSLFKDTTQCSPGSNDSPGKCHSSPGPSWPERSHCCRSDTLSDGEPCAYLLKTRCHMDRHLDFLVAAPEPAALN